ncbi:sensor histidine kinase [Nocardioides acrostichi]|uniref:histidine kinase n=1 Tax=Nocardioides acrostichi TaxID=2784339 RepID=A0A930UYV6_9ACTN|nr:ATP-binding protein [Nocardioides acrostichi]MBF4160114.1 PAS domain S-box protein [Nocardioides acrostichi]
MIPGLLERARLGSGTVGSLAMLALSWFLATVTLPTSAGVGWPEGFWPLGLALGALRIQPTATARLLTPLVTLMVGVTALAQGADWDVAVVLALTATAAVAVTEAALRHDDPSTFTLKGTHGLLRYGLGSLAGGAVLLPGGLLAATMDGDVDVLLAAGGWTVLGMSSFAAYLPLFASMHDHRPVAPVVELWLQRALLLVFLAMFAIPADSPPLILLIVPILVWAADRARAGEALAQLYLVIGVVGLLTSAGRGTLSGMAKAYGVDEHWAVIVQSVFIMVLAVVTVTVMVRIGEQSFLVDFARAERDRLDAVVQAATGTAIIVTDEDVLISAWNPGAERLLGYSADEVIGCSPAMLHSAEAIHEKGVELGLDDPDDFNLICATLLRPEHRGTLYRFRRKDGVERWHSFTLNVVAGDTGAAAFVATSEDVTERIENEHALARTLERLKEVDRLKDTFVSSISHELRTPMASIGGYLELLLEGHLGVLSGEQRQALGRVQANNNRLGSLVEDLLTLSRAQAMPTWGTVDEHQMDLREVVVDGFEMAVPALERPDLKLELRMPEERVDFAGSRQLLESLVSNLVGNAVKFTPDDGSVLAELTSDDAEVQIVVQDSGIGIPVDEQERLFDNFFRSSISVQRAIPGTGLGLSIVRAVVRAYQGSIAIDSAEGRGTTVRVRLPLARAENPGPETDEPVHATGARPGAGGSAQGE